MLNVHIFISCGSGMLGIRSGVGKIDQHLLKTNEKSDTGIWGRGGY